MGDMDAREAYFDSLRDAPYQASYDLTREEMGAPETHCPICSEELPEPDGECPDPGCAMYRVYEEIRECVEHRIKLARRIMEKERGIEYVLAEARIHAYRLVLDDLLASEASTMGDDDA